MGMIQQQDALSVYQDNHEAYLKGLRAFSKDLSDRVELLPGLYSERDFHTFTIYVHGLKTAARNIGAISFSEFSAQMLEWSKKADEHSIRTNLRRYLSEANHLYEELRHVLEEEARKKKLADAGLERREQMDTEVLLKMKQAAEEMDMMQMEDCIEELQKYQYYEKPSAFLRKLIHEEEEFEYNEIARLLSAYLNR